MAEPSISLRAYRKSSGSNLPVVRIVIHATCGRRGYPRESAAGVARQTAQYFQSSSAGGSAHYVCDIDREEHTLPDDAIAWHAPPNQHSIGIEICADGGAPYGTFRPYTREQWLSPKVWPAVERAARRARELCKRHGIPLQRLTVAQVRAGKAGICGHADVSAAFGQSDHTDPGPAFPWAEFMAAVAGKPQQQPQEEEPMPKIVSLGVAKPQTLAPGKSADIAWTKEYGDEDKAHSGTSPAIMTSAAYWCIAHAQVHMTGLKEGDRVELSWVRVHRDGKADKDVCWGPIPTPPAPAQDGTAAELGGQFQVDTKVQLRLRVRNPNSYPIAVMPGTMAKLMLMTH